jgi:hypothetical protein
VAAEALGWIRGEAAVPTLVERLKVETNEEVRREICRALAKIAGPARAVLEAVVPALAEVADADPSEAVQITAILALELARPRGRGLNRSLVSRSDLAVQKTPPASGPKREDIELLKSLLALLDTCLEWPEEGKDARVSDRALHRSSKLKENRQRLGLPERISVATVHNHLKSLARVCKVDSLTDPEPKNQFSTFRVGVKERLRARRGFLQDEIAKEEDTRRLAPPGQLEPLLPKPDVIA